MSAGLTNMDIASLVIDPAHPDTLYAGTFGGGVFRIDQQAGLPTPTPMTPTSTPSVAVSTATPQPSADTSSCRIVGGGTSGTAWALLVPAAALLALRRRRRR